MLVSEVDFMSFQEKLRRELDSLGEEVLKKVLEAKDAYLPEHREEQPRWEVVR
jgi:hypothetical protein